MKRLRARATLPAALLAMALMAGCQQPMGMNGEEVMGLPSRDVVGLDADDIAYMMIRAGFTNAEIVKLGPGIRNALASSGGARVRVGKTTEAMFATIGKYVHVSSRQRGSFIYDPVEGKCR